MRDRTKPLVFLEAGRVEYQAAWDWQRRLADERVAGGSDTVLLLEHPDTYTAGRRTRPEDLPTDGTPVVEVDRGGRITWHGPGQLVGYPVIGLSSPMDVVGYVRLLEEALITVCDDMGLSTGRIDGRSGVWLAAEAGRPERKIAAIGVRIARGVTTHGFALNCDPDLRAFDRIVPCGIADAGVTSLSAETGRHVGIAELLPVVRARLTDMLDGRLAVTERAVARDEPGAVGATLPGGVSWALDPALAGR
ncbi:lipoyl(octanoyl) transferase LipB [Nakamurella flavida]|uniref:Octanoyltransferase n=1 Tax=Nakamurella flavida TaxID=363630 RepID=A0A939C452_9ACTN|nr:lipoyl(octanoyl) transferase LipB [Nakamurella flavida]MBM9474872.1 lipoyl(octanoyl) transferase LipB [Nakamurella flavida]MDP9776442.1 lipoyl(octanoyl) transferase [Nakamurella flavida]